MENTTKHIYEYFKTNLDILVNWVEFQNSFGRIPNTSSFEFTPKLYKMKEDLMLELEEYLSDENLAFNTTTVKQLVVSSLISKLNEEGYPQVVPYVTNLNESKLIELTTSLFTRRSVLTSLSRMEDIKLENDNDTNRLYNTYLHNLRWLRLSTSFTHPDFSENLSSVFMESLPIEQSNDASSLSYMSQVIFNIKRLEYLYLEIMNRNGIEVETIEDINRDLDTLQIEIDALGKVNSFNSLINTMASFESHINSLKQLTNPKDQPKSLKLV